MASSGLLMVCTPLTHQLHSLSPALSPHLRQSASCRNSPNGIHVVAQAREERDGPTPASEERSSKSSTRRDLILNSTSIGLLAFTLGFSGTKPGYLGLGRTPPSLALCPSTPNCISTSEEINDPGHYVPPWTYNPEDAKRKNGKPTQEQAMAELVSVVTSTKPDGFVPTIIEQRPDYLYVQYESPFFGFVDDVEFWFPPGPGSRVEYRSASRLGESDFNINRKRIKALRQELQKYGWVSVGY